MFKYLKNYTKGDNNYNTWKGFIENLSNKQKIALIALFVCIAGNIYFAYAGTSTGSWDPQYTSLDKAVAKIQGIRASWTYFSEYASLFDFIGIVRKTLKYIADVQLNSIGTVAGMSVSTKGVFDHIVNGLTVFAVIGIIVQIIKHFLKTERYDSVSAFTGFFSYFGMLLLFIFSPYIVNRVVSLNKGVTGNQVRTIGQKLDNELVRKLAVDYLVVEKQLEDLDDKKTNGNMGATVLNIGKDLEYSIKKGIIMTGAFFSGIFTYLYFSIISIFLVCILAIPAFIMAFMIKMLLSIMVAGTKLVFLVSLIPGFENTWKTFMLNMLNVVLWAPIFVFMMNFISDLVVAMMVNNAVGVGQALWLTIVVFIMAFQAVTLTTTAAGTIISGAGASMAGALGGLASMNGVAMGASMAKGAVSLAGTVATSGMTAGMTAKSMSKYIK